MGVSEGTENNIRFSKKVKFDDAVAFAVSANDDAARKYNNEALSQVNPQLHYWLSTINENASTDTVAQTSTKSNPQNAPRNSRKRDVDYMAAVESGDKETQQDEQTINELRERVSDLTEQLDLAWANDLSETEERRLRNELVKVNADPATPPFTKSLLVFPRFSDTIKFWIVKPRKEEAYAQKTLRVRARI